MRLAEPVVGLGQPVVLHLADPDPVHRHQDRAAERERQDRRHRVDADLVERAAEQVLGQDVGAAARGEERLARDEARLDGDVHRAVADPDDEHVLVAEVGVVDVVVRVHLHAVERAGERGSGQRGSQWWPLATSSAS